MSSSSAYIIVVGNEKGGCGKTTISMHLAVSLLYEGMRVATIDLDARQRTLSRYVENRLAYMKKENISLPNPAHFIVKRSALENKEEVEADEGTRFEKCLNKAMSENQVVIIDAPGNDTFLSRLSHSHANTIVTPINDSFLDLDVIAHVDGDTLDMSRPGVYSEMIWQAKIQRAKRDRGEIDWVILRNRLSNLDAHNKRKMSDALDKLARKTGARVAQGLSERVILRELFLNGMTLLDVMEQTAEKKLRISHLAARQELRELVHFLDLKYRIQQKLEHKDIEATAAADRESGVDNKEELSEEKIDTAQDNEVKAPIERVADEPAVEEAEKTPAQTDITGQKEIDTNAYPEEHHHYTLAELEAIEAEIEEREGVVDRLEDLEEKMQEEARGALPHGDNRDAAETDTGEDTSSAPQKTSNENDSALSEETRVKLAQMLEETKRVLEETAHDANQHTGSAAE